METDYDYEENLVGTFICCWLRVGAEVGVPLLTNFSRRKWNLLYS